MRKRKLIIKGAITFLLSVMVVGFIQAQSNSEKEIIIIEKTIDENGNEISKKIIRKNGNDISDEELENLLKNDNGPFGLFDLNSFGFGPNSFKNWGGTSKSGDGIKDDGVTIGLSLSFENNRVEVIDVVKGSGAYDSDIRKGDELVSIEGSAISNYDDIKEILKNKKDRDEVRIKVYRDGEEHEKIVTLKNNNFNNFPFQFPQGFDGGKLFFDFDGDGFDIQLDSVFGLFGQSNMDSLLYNFRRGQSPLNRNFESDNNEQRDLSDKPSLGVFIDDSSRKVEITEVLEGSAADLAGLLEGDIIIRFNDEIITSFRELSMLMNRVERGETVDVLIERKGKETDIQIKLD